MDYKNKYYKYKTKYLNLVGGDLTNKQKKLIGLGSAVVLAAAAATATAVGIKKGMSFRKSDEEYVTENVERPIYNSQDVNHPEYLERNSQYLFHPERSEFNSQYPSRPEPF